MLSFSNSHPTVNVLIKKPLKKLTHYYCIQTEMCMKAET